MIHIGLIHIGALLLSTTTIAAGAAREATAAPNAFDGKWSVKLVCDDVKEHGAVAKGYTYVFDVNVQNGHLEGRRGQPDAPGSAQYSGTIDADGSATIDATGRTGDPDRTIGAVGRGTPYSYQMHGQFEKAFGRAERTTLRPCEATFTKYQ